MRLLSLVWVLVFSTSASAETVAKLITDHGAISIRLYEGAPKTMMNFVKLAKGEIRYTDLSGKKVRGRPFYDGLIFHRTHPDLGIFTGCPWGNGRGWPGYFIPDEASESSRFDRPGLVGMAKIPGDNRVGSQFFITTKALPRLSGKYTLFGEVVSGMDVVQKIANVDRDIFLKPKEPVHLKKIEITSDQ